MSLEDFALVARWFGALWLGGWLVLPLSRQLFPRLPDAGLSAGRVAFVVGATLLCFWGAALHLVPLRFAPVVWVLLAFGAAWNWRDPAMRAWVRENRRSLAVSDAVFILAWTLFLWVRLCHPEANDLEKPMDMALLSAGMRADWLPFQNPWFSGTNFTNYYYFGHLMGALLSRNLFTAPHLAYNLVQPAFCAFFLSVLWSVGGALAGSLRGGIGVMLLVGLGGHFEPLRQIIETHKLAPIDWWKTSRVIPDTINEYPAFTLAVGDLHAHFFALPLATLWFALLVQFGDASPRRWRFTLLICGIILGAWLMTNTWDAPLFGLLLASTGLTSALRYRNRFMRVGESVFPLVGWILTPFFLAFITALPYLVRFKSQVSGAKFDPWVPDLLSFWLLWGAWGTLAILAFMAPRETGTGADAPERTLRRLLTGVGLLALVAPFVFYIKGAFGDGPLRHQDTVFKFGLQAWLLLGTGIASEFFARLRGVNWADIRTRLAQTNNEKADSKITRAEVFWERGATLVSGLALVPLLALAPIWVIWARACAYGSGPWSLNAMRFLPQADQTAIEWLQTHAAPESVVLENEPRPAGLPGNNMGLSTRDYNPICGRVATFSGLPAPLGWPQHVEAWGVSRYDIMARDISVNRWYRTPNLTIAKHEFNAKYIFFGANEGPPPATLPHEATRQNFLGDDGSHATVIVVD